MNNPDTLYVILSFLTPIKMVPMLRLSRDINYSVSIMLLNIKKDDMAIINYGNMKRVWIEMKKKMSVIIYDGTNCGEKSDDLVLRRLRTFDLSDAIVMLFNCKMSRGLLCHTLVTFDNDWHKYYANDIKFVVRIHNYAEYNATDEDQKIIQGDNFINIRILADDDCEYLYTQCVGLYRNRTIIGDTMCCVDDVMTLLEELDLSNIHNDAYKKIKQYKYDEVRLPY